MKQRHTSNGEMNVAELWSANQSGEAVKIEQLSNIHQYPQSTINAPNITQLCQTPIECILVKIHGLSQWLKRSTSPSCAFFQHFSAAVGASGLTCWRGWKIIVKINNEWSSYPYHFKKKTLYNIVIQSYRKKVQNIYIEIFTPPSVFTPTKSFQHATRKAGSITDQVKPSALANKALVGLCSFRHTSHLLSPTMLIILDSIHLIIQDTILETLPFLLRVTRLSNANNRRPDMSSSLTSVVAIPAGSCSLWIRIETWHCLGTDWSFTNSQMAWVAAGVLWKVPPLSSPKSNTTTPAARMHLRQLLHHSQEHRSLWSFWMSRHLEWMVCRSKMFRVTKVETIWVVKQRQIKTSCHPKH